MNVATPQYELLQRLAEAGWSLRSIDFRQGTYIAKADNEVTGQDIQRTGRTPELALASVLQFAQRATAIRRMAALQKFAAWDDDFLDQAQEIGVAYAKMPVFDQKAVPAWKALAAESKIQADAIKRQITVQVVDEPEPYMSAQEMVEDIHKNRHFAVSRANCEHPIWSPEDNINFRIVHDVLGQAQSGGDFSWVGENKACAVHFPLVSPLAREALFTECIGQQAYYRAFHGFGPQKIGFLSQFLHPVQEQQGEHVWVPHGGIPELQPAPNMNAAGTMDQAPGSQALFNSPGEWRSIDPAGSQMAPPSPVMGPSAVMQGFKTTTKAKADWGEQVVDPSNIPIRPEREIEYPDWQPEEDPLTVPEEWPEEAPAPAPEREKEPALTHVLAADQLPYTRMHEPGYGWKVLEINEDGTLISPAYATVWPVGRPLIAEGDISAFQRGVAGIHLVPEGHWKELYDYVNNSGNRVLVKCQIFGKSYEGSTAHGRGILAIKAMPVLVVGTDKQLLLKVANKYGIDTDFVGSQDGEEHDTEEGLVFEQDGWRIVDPSGLNNPIVTEASSSQYRDFFTRRDEDGGFAEGTHTFQILDPRGEAEGEMTVKFGVDYDAHLDFCVVEDISADADAIPFVHTFFTSLSVPATYDKNEAWHQGDWQYETSEWRDHQSVNGADDVVALASGRQTRYGYSLDNMSYDNYSYEWTDEDVRWSMGETDVYGVHPWEITISEPAPPDLQFSPETWQHIFRDEVNSLAEGWRNTDTDTLAIGLVEIPSFILSEGAQSDTESHKEWQGVGGLAFIRSQVAGVRDNFGARPQDLEEFLNHIESILTQTQIHPDQQQVVKPVENWQKKTPGDPSWTPWQEINAEQQQIPGTFGKAITSDRDPSYLFVYYKSELRVKKYEHDLRMPDMLEDLLKEYGINNHGGLDIDPSEVAAGEVFAYPDGEYRVEHKQLSDPEVREHAEELLDEWLAGWRSLNQIRDPETGQFV